MTTTEELRAERDRLTRNGRLQHEAAELAGVTPKPKPAKRQAPKPAEQTRRTSEQTRTVAELRRIYYGGSPGERFDLLTAMRRGEVRVAH